MNDAWVWKWDRISSPRVRTLDALQVLVDAFSSENIYLSWNLKDSWFWTLDKNGLFLVDSLKILIEEKLLTMSEPVLETQWLKIIPRKINILSGGLSRVEYQSGLLWSIKE